jgi:uncharacterized Zn finger protein (UPF0148 family)
MSDFDAEAERERLREKYEADEESRKRTQQMSELLLKGATMTNGHCGECGSPIFRYEGREFCPSCQRAVGEGADGADAADASGGRNAGATAAEQPTGPDAESDAGAAGTPRSDASAGAEAEPTPEERAASGAGTPASNGIGAAESDDRGGREPVSGTDQPRIGDRTASGSGDDGSAPAPTRRAARESLLAALTRHARLAADADEPRRATDHLTAAREAAAALAELDGA